MYVLSPVVATSGRRLPWLLAILCALSLVSQARSAEPTPTDEAQTGLASWHRGTNCTASGRRWAAEELVAAHRSLPLGATVRVVNVRNGRQTVVRITDRGPYARGRIIDLSVAAARELGCLEAGTAQVRLEVVAPASAPLAQAGSLPPVVAAALSGVRAFSPAVAARGDIFAVPGRNAAGRPLAQSSCPAR